MKLAMDVKLKYGAELHMGIPRTGGGGLEDSLKPILPLLDANELQQRLRALKVPPLMKAPLISSSALTRAASQDAECVRLSTIQMLT